MAHTPKQEEQASVPGHNDDSEGITYRGVPPKRLRPLIPASELPQRSASHSRERPMGNEERRVPKIEIDEPQIPPLRTPDRKAQNTSPYLGGECGARAGRERHDQPSESMSWELVDINRRFDGIEELCRRQDEKLDSLKSTLQNFLEIFLDMMRGNGGQNLAERPRGAAGS